MSNAPIYSIDPTAFWHDPYPDLAAMRSKTPICFVPELGATLLTRRDTIFDNEKKIDLFSSDQPQGLMTLLLGQNMMRKDGAPHKREREAVFPSLSPRTVKEHWLAKFDADAKTILDELTPRGEGDLFVDYALRLSANALREITGLTNMSYQEMNRVSQGMIDGVANYSGDPEVEARCRDCTASIDRHIDERLRTLEAEPDASMLSVQLQAGLTLEQARANIKLAISGGQNEPRDAIAGAIWALLSHPAQLQQCLRGETPWLKAFEEYARWVSPIGMSPRRVARAHCLDGVQFDTDDRVFLMFSSANRDEEAFDEPNRFNINRDLSDAVTFGAGPHFCAGAWASRALIAEVALPRIFERLNNLSLNGEIAFGGWAFRGPLSLPCRWSSAKASA